MCSSDLEEDVDLAQLLGRLRAMLVQDVGASGHEVSAELEPVMLAGHRATALALVFSELLGNAFEHGGVHVSIRLRAVDGECVLEIVDDGTGIPAEAKGTGLSIVRALVRDELGGTLELAGSEGGTRAEVRFPA